MAGSAPIATAALGLVPVITGVQGNIARELSRSGIVSQASNAGGSIGSKIGSAITSGLKRSLQIGGVVTAALSAVTLKGGFDRALGIEDAQALMRGLGHDAKSVDQIMGNALASVEGTAFGLDSAATTAAGAIAAGIKPGEQLEATLTTVANTAAAAKAPMEDIGSIFNTVAAVGTAYTGDINMLAQRGLPIWQALASELGVTQAQVKKMASEGKIDFQTFETAAAAASGNVAKSMGDTTRGSFANMMAAVRKLGAMFATGILPIAKTAFQGVQGLINATKAKLEPFVTGFFDRFGGSAQAGVKGFFDGLIARVNAFDMGPVVAGFSAAGDAIQGALSWVKGLDFSSISGVLSQVAGAVRGIASGVSGGSALGGIGGALADIAAASPDVLALGLEAVAAAMQFLADNADTIKALLPVIAAVIVANAAASRTMEAAVQANTAAYHALLPVMVANNIARIIATESEANYFRMKLAANSAELQSVGAKSASTLATVRGTIAQRAATIATKAGALATRLFGAALRFATGPIGLIITGVTLVGVALWAFFTKTDAGRKMWATIWGGIKAAAAAVMEWARSTLLPILVSVWNGIASGAQWLYSNVILPVWEGIKVAIAIAAAAVMTYLDAWKAFFQNIIAPVFTWLWRNVIIPVWDGIKAAISGVVSWFQTVAWPVIQTVISWVRSGFDVLKAAIGVAWAWIRDNAINPVISWFQGTAWPVISRVIGYVKTGFNTLKDAVGRAWSWIRDNAIKPVVTWLTGTLWPKVDGVIQKIKSGFSVMKDAVGKSWKAIEGLAKAPINFVINKVWNEGIVGNFSKIRKIIPGLPELKPWAGLARGGVLPGWSRMSDGDDQLVPMRRGEGVIVSEALRTAKDKALFLAANAAGRKGVGFSDFMQGRGFARGGIFDAAGDTLDWMKDQAGKVWDFVSDPIGALKGAVGKLMGGIPGAGLFWDLAKGIGKKILGGAAEAVSRFFGGAGGGSAAPVGPVPAGASRSLGYAQQVARSMGLTMTSGKRGGARTSSGIVSLHALGRAMDFSNSSGPTPQMMAFFNAMHPLKPTELLYSPAGGRQWHRSGKMHDTTGTTKRIHYNHVHVGFAGGGIYSPGAWAKPLLYDQGGALPPGLSVTLNKHSRPETVLPPAESEALRRIAKNGEGKAVQFTYAPTQVDLDEQVQHRTRREFEAMVHEVKKVGSFI